MSTSINWPAWPRTNPAQLARYVVPDVVGRHARVPQRSGEAPLALLRETWRELADRNIGYAYEPDAPQAVDDEQPTAARVDVQVIRPPGEVLVAPGSGTCLDVALLLAAACLTAGLPAAVVLLTSVRRAGGAGHAVVAVAIDGAWPDGTPTSGVWETAPTGFADQVAHSLDGPPRPLVVLDPVGLTRSLGSSPILGTAATLEEAGVAGARYLTGGDWAWQAGIPVARRDDAYRPAALPDVLPLRGIYREPGTAESPLRLLRAEYQVTPFQSRDELTVLADYCDQVAAGDRLGFAVLHGVGGAGKTRLALELAARLRADGWYAGPLLDDLHDPASTSWLATVTAPLAVVVDYADARTTETNALLQTLAARQGPPTVVILTARSTDGGWLQKILGAQTASATPFRIEEFELPDTHPRPGDVYERTAAAMRATDPASPASPIPPLRRPSPGRRWTTLDLVLLGWAAAQGTGPLPTSHDDLYNEILDHERRYWTRAYTRINREREPEPDILDHAAACLTLLTPPPAGAASTLRAVPELDEDSRERRDVARALTTCFDPGPHQKLSLRPDPIGDHHLLIVLRKHPALLTRALPPPADRTGQADAEQQADLQRLLDALVVLTRAGQNDPDAAAAHIETLLRDGPDRWPVVLAAATSLGGPSRTALERLTVADDTPLDLDALSANIPLQPLGLWQLGQLVDDRRLAETPPDDPQRRADLLLLVSHRRVLAGDRLGALAAIDEGVAAYRQLADVNPSVYLPDLAGSLNNQAARRADVGDLAGALVVIDEAVTLRRQLAEANPAAYLPDLAGSLNNQGVWRADVGDLAGALVVIDEAVTLRRQLAEANPAAYLPDLATSLNNQSNRRAAVGDPAGALAAIDEAVVAYRQLGNVNPSVYLPGLATALNNQSNRRANVGNPAGALVVIDEAVTLRRQLAEANPAAYLPDLAMSLNNQAARRAAVGDSAGALVVIDEAVTLHRQLADVNRSVYLPDLAGSLNNQANLRADVGDLAGALIVIDEAVVAYRQLAEANPAAYLPSLATALNNQAARRAAVGDSAGALVVIDEAVTLHRQLAEANPAAYLPDLAGSLNNQSNRRAAVGDSAGALVVIDEAVTIRRRLAEANPAAYLPSLATALNSQAAWRAAVGDSAGALVVIDEAVTIHRQLAEANPAAYLPDLATSLNNQAARRAAVGDPPGALATIDEAVVAYRQLAEANPAAYLPDLATSLNNQSNRRAAVGDPAGALAAIDEAVVAYRQLAEANRSVYLPDLATSLNNQSNRRAAVGDPAGALIVIDEAVTLHRQLADVNRSVYLPDLAGSLNNQANLRAAVGDPPGALATIDEAVIAYRQLAEANPAAYLPDLAMSLNNQAVHRAEVGDRTGALVVIDEAVTIRRQLAEANPAAYLPDLATSLNNQASRRAEVGDRTGALVVIDEAVTIRRQLAEANPAAYLPDFAASLRCISDLCAAGASEALAGQNLWETAITKLTNPLAQGELRGHFAACAISQGDHRKALDLLRQAAVDVETDPADQPPYLVTRARTTVRAAAQQLPDAPANLPSWAISPLPDTDIDLVNAWQAATDWDQREAAITTYGAPFPRPTLPQTLDILDFLYPDRSVIDELRALLTAADDQGLSAVLADQRAQHDTLQTVSTWIGKDTWNESFKYLADHRDRLITNEVTHLLAQSDEPVARQHLAILLLSTRLQNQDVFTIVTDPSAAADHALDAIETGHLNQLALLLQANSNIARLPGTGLFLLTVLTLATGNTDQATTLARAAAATATPLQCRANAIRLRKLHETAVPSLNGDALQRVIAILADDVPNQPPAQENTTDTPNPRR